MLIEEIINEASEHISNTRLGGYDRNLPNVLKAAQNANDAEWEQAVRDRMDKIGVRDPAEVDVEKRADKDKKSADRKASRAAEKQEDIAAVVTFLQGVEHSIGDLIGADQNEVPGAWDGVNAAYGHLGMEELERIFDWFQSNAALIKNVLKNNYSWNGDLDGLIGQWHKDYWADQMADRKAGKNVISIDKYR